MLLNKTYYQLKPFIPRHFQIFLRRQFVQRKRSLCNNVWPIDDKAGKSPDGWSGWPEQKQFALILTHDVDTAEGQEKCRTLMKLEESLGFRSSFNFVPERYNVSPILREELSEKGFEVGVHGLNHDGKLFSSREEFQKRAIRINHYLKEWKSSGFRSPAMHHNLEWIHDLNIKYDASTFDTDPFEPQSDGMRTIFPFWVSMNGTQNGYVELPYTLPQDFTLFILMKEKNIDIWKHKLDWIAQKGGMALLNVHPDYMNFEGKEPGIEEYAAVYYQHFLEYIKSEYEGQYWHMLPSDLASFFVKDFCNNQKI
ncbi:MAG: hypothetical protein ACW990_05770 [Promethearchaeota archaeon]|jgi:peptidoglycan/xylan/chitin deacetylase (PgdA/CDA1 family)